MKTSGQSPQGNPLRKNNDRWKWMAGATAATAAGATCAHATTAQISLINNTLDSNNGINVSLTVDGVSAFASGAASIAGPTLAELGIVWQSAVNHQPLAYVVAKANTGIVHPYHARVYIRGLGASAATLSAKGTTPCKVFGFLPLAYTDPAVNNGLANTECFLEIEAFNTSSTDQTIALLNLFYTEGADGTTSLPDLTIDNTSGDITGSYTNVGSSDAGVFTPAAVPEPSGLALLALGAGGILARRRLRKAA